jgi:hypothetical protein
MAEILKVLGQTSATAAQASDVLNLVKDPTFEGMTAANASLYASGSQVWAAVPNTLWNWQASSSYSQSMYIASTLYLGSQWDQFKSTTGLKSDSQFGSQAIVFGSTTNPGNYAYWYLTYGLSKSVNGGNTTNSSYFGGFNNAIPVTGSTSYRFGLHTSAYQYSTYNMTVMWFDTNGSYVGNSVLSISPGSSTFNRNLSTVTSPASAAYAGIEIQFEGYLNSRAQGAIDGVYLGTAASLSSTTPDPSSTAGNLLVAPFTERYNSTWAGNINSSVTIKNYAGLPVDAYTVPSAKAAVVSSIVVANPTTSATSYRIAVVPSGETLALKHWNFFDIPLGATSSTAITLGLTLRAGDKIKVSSDTSNTQFSVYGSELDQA